ncbi:MAG: carboxypeptidase regulatory-like domain-containing protein, partial [Chloroflexi bacterium]|nr:carboxypeptidase regulatory-like domain-containing protein [Chloroflexota bacterium]
SPLPNGEYTIEYYIGEDLLTSGTVIVGEGPTPPGDDVAVEGTVVDAKSKKPINGALVVVLNEGVDAEQWLEDGADEDVFAFAKTNSKGQFELNNRIPTGVAYPWMIGAKGYRTILEQEFTIEEGVDDPYVLNIALERQK